MTDYARRAVMLFLIIIVVLLSISHVKPRKPVQDLPYVPDKAPSVAVEPQTPEIVADIPQNPAQATFEDLLDAIEWVESRGDANAVGDNGNAVGSFQIWKIYIDDVNRICKLYGYYQPVGHYVYKDRWDKYCSRYMVKIYLEHYATAERIGRKPTFEDMARIHNGGPNGWKKESTKPYWEKVKARLEL